MTSGNDKIITIPQSVHGMQSNGISVSLRILQNGAYIQNTWAARECYAVVDNNHNIILTMPDCAGVNMFAGRAELFG